MSVSTPESGTNQIVPFTFVELREVPIQCNVLHRTPEDALRAPRGNIQLAFCPSTGLVFNTAFDPKQMAYEADYENALHHSPRFESYTADLAKRLVSTYGLRGKRLLGIGCGDGYFLRLLCQEGNNQAWGFDPSHCPTPSGKCVDDRVTILSEYFDPARLTERSDFVCCRHVLEHIPDPLAFLRQLRLCDALQQAAFYFEVPDARYTLQHEGYWDILYEHRSYFTDVSLSALFREAGFRVLGTRTAFAGQFLQLQAVPHLGEPPADIAESAAQIRDLEECARSFAHGFDSTVRKWTDHFERCSAEGQKIAVWGAGTKGVMFLNGVDRQRRAVYVVDVNPKKQGCFVAGTGHPIVSPGSLQNQPPDCVLLMNPAYRGEVRQQLKNLGIDQDLAIV